MKTSKPLEKTKKNHRSIGPRMGDELRYDAVCTYRFHRKYMFEKELQGEIDRINQHFSSLSSVFILPPPVIKPYKFTQYGESFGFIMEVDVKYVIHEASYIDIVNYERLFSLIANFERDMGKRYDNMEYLFNIAQHLP